MSYVPAATGPLALITSWVARRQYGSPIDESARILAREPRLGIAFSRFNRAVERRRAIPRGLADLAVLRAAQLVECEFCLDIGSAHARRSGLTDEQLLALGRPEASGRFDADERLVLEYAEALSRTPVVVAPELAERLRARFGDRGLLELAYLVGWENHRARLNAGLGIGAGGFSTGRVCAVPQSAQPAATVAA